MWAGIVLRAAWLLAGVGLPALTGSCRNVEDAEPQSAGTQGWTAQQTSDWYGGKQGSRLMPYSWFKALEQPTAAAPFATPTHMATFRFLSRTDQPLPVGFAVDDNDDEKMTFSRLRWYAGQGSKEQWVGLNCSACHTGEIAFGDKPPMRIEGAPSLVDFQMFTDALDAAMIATRDDPAKWERFVKAVLDGKDTPDNRALLKTEYGKLLDWQMKVAKLDHSPLRYGYGRLDAVGRIYNKVALFSGAATPIANTPDAPVSYPFLWDIWRQDKLQWNGIAQSRRLKLGNDRFFDYGAMGRNAGEVIGVFGDIDTRPVPAIQGFHASIWADNLDRLEIQLRSLKAPVWPAAYFPTSADQQSVADGRREAGRALFASKGCAGCHGSFGPEVTQYQVTMVPLRASERDRTDVWMACNAFTYNARSGNLTGVSEDYIKGRKLGQVEPTGTLLATTVKGTLIGKKGQLLRQTANTFLGINRAPVALPQDFPDTPEGRVAAREARCISEDNPLLAYKARPLDGIWATAPYLHNGSVPTLYDLLLPAAQRPAEFYVGTRQYDPERVGYVTARTAPGNGFRFDTSLRGNSNKGHDYGVGALTPEERWSLVEYMKSL